MHVFNVYSDMTPTDLLMRLLSDLAYARIVFFRESRNPMDTRLFLTNESHMLRAAQNTSIPSITTLLLSTLPSTFFDPVTVNLTPEQIEASVRPLENAPAHEACCICQEGLHTQPACSIQRCGHSLHRACATQWFALSVRCPVCRADLRESANNTNNNVRS